MTAPLLDAAPLAALPVGLAFGAALERAGLGNARTIADQLAGKDFTVVKVMMSAIVTALLLLFWSDRLGWLDLSRVAMPETDLVPQLIGAAIFGAGFALASLCPGTACVAAATGARDGVAAMVGLFLGSLATGITWPALGVIAERFPRDRATLPADLGLSTGVVVGIIVVVALVVMRWIARLDGQSLRRHAPLGTVAVVLGALAVLTGNQPLANRMIGEQDARGAAKDADVVDAIQVAEWIHDRRAGLRVIDLRESLSADAYRLPGATAVPLSALDTFTVLPAELLVLYGDDAALALRGRGVLRARGVTAVRVLQDGIAGWERDVMAPLVPSPGDSVALARYRRVRPLTEFFGGMPRLEQGPPTRPARRNTC